MIEVTANPEKDSSGSILDWRILVILMLSVGLTSLPFYKILLFGELSGIYNSVASDTYYYLRLAQAFLDSGITTFDGETPTNGYNPAWQIVMIAVAYLKSTAGGEPEDLLRAAFLLNLGLVAAATFILSVSFLRTFSFRIAVLANSLLVPGTFFLVFDQAYKRAGDPGILYGFSNWSFVNGMESGLGYFFWAIVVAMLFKFFRSPDRSDLFFLIFGLFGFLVAFTRLDDVFLGVAMFFGILPYLLAERRFRAILAFCLVPVLGFAIYIGFNQVVFGTGLPVSGVSKTNLFSFPTGPKTFIRLSDLGFFAQRLLPMCGLLAFGGIILCANEFQKSPSWRRSVINVLAGYLVLKYLFLFSSVHILDQGYWYYTLGIASFNVIVVLLLLEALDGLRGRAFLGAVGFAGLGLFVIGMHFEQHLSRFTDDSYTRVWHHLCSKSAELRQKIEAAARDKGLEYRAIDTGDGAVSFCLRLPSISITGLADSLEVLSETEEKGLLRAAYDRGHRIIVQNDADWGSYFDISRAETEGFVLEIIYRDDLIVAYALNEAIARD